MKVLNAFLVVLIYLLAGCVQHAEKEARSNVAAVVNGVEITQREVDYFYRRNATPGMSPTDSLILCKGILSELVTTELLAQKAHKMNLEKKPDYPIALYHSHKKLMAGLAGKELAKVTSKPASAQIKSVIDNNPGLFADRQLFIYDEINISSVDTTLLNALDKKIESGATLEMLGEYLQLQKIDYSFARKSITTDQMAPKLVDAVIRMKIGTPQILRVSNKYSMVILLHNRLPVPITGKAAQINAINLINASQSNAAFREAMANLVNESRITYFSDYARMTMPSGDDLVTLPVPSQEKQSKKKYKDIILNGLLGSSFMLAVMVLTAMMRIIMDTLWVPRLWPAKKTPYEEANLYEIPFEVQPFAKIVLLVIAISVVIILANEIRVLAGAIPYWSIGMSIVGGIIAGVGASQIFRWKLVMNWSDKIYMLIVIVLTLPVILSLFMIIRLSGV